MRSTGAQLSRSFHRRRSSAGFFVVDWLGSNGVAGAAASRSSWRRFLAFSCKNSPAIGTRRRGSGVDSFDFGAYPALARVFGLSVAGAKLRGRSSPLPWRVRWRDCSGALVPHSSPRPSSLRVLRAGGRVSAAGAPGALRTRGGFLGKSVCRGRSISFFVRTKSFVSLAGPLRKITKSLPSCCTPAHSSFSQISAYIAVRDSRSSLNTRTLMSVCAVSALSISCKTLAVKPCWPTMTTGSR